MWESPTPVTPRGADTVSLEELLGHLRTVGRRGRGMSREDASDFELPPVLRSRGVPIAFGCLKRVAVLLIIGAILFAMAAAWFFSSVIVI